MGYFSEIPNLEYPSQLGNRLSRSNETIEVKNFFRRTRLRDDVNGIVFSDFYEIQDNERPEMVAEKFYDDPELDWVILTTNNIINVRDQWPLSNNELYTHMLQKYGTEEQISQVHHYETRKVLDEYGRIVLNSGLIVDEDFSFTYTTTTGTSITQNVAGPVSNFDYETRVNNQKRVILVLKPDYLSVVVNEFEEIMKYERSSDYITEKLKKVYNPRVSGV